MEPSDQRTEPRFALGGQVKIALHRGANWREIAGFTVNVSDHGLLVTLSEAPEVGEHVRVEFSAPDDSWGEAVVKRVVRGTANFLVAMRLREKHST